MASNKRKVEGNFQMSDLFDWTEKGSLKGNDVLKSGNGFNGKLKNACQLITSKITYSFAL